MHINPPESESDASAMDQRLSDRFGIALPITMQEGFGETHDISETGILFETEFEPRLGAKLALTLQYSMDGKDYHMGCEAEVVRVQRVGSRVNVGARLLTHLVSEQ